MRLLSVLTGLFLLLAAWTAAAAPAGLYAGHPLTGTLWDTRLGQQVKESAFLAEAVAARWVLLGEKHDNAAHHRLQARILAALGAAGRRPAVVWEMAEPEHAEALRAAGLENAERLGPDLQWEARGWPSWAEYRPIAEAALRYGLPMWPGKPSRQLVRAVSRGEPLPDELAARFGWRQPYPEDLEVALLAELRESHCSRLPETALPGMLRVQRLGDAWMADSLLGAGADADGAVLIAGSGHVREDRAVPWHLLRRGAGESLTLALVEVAFGRDRPADYAAFDPAQFDYVWFTPRVDEKDPCAAFQ